MNLNISIQPTLPTAIDVVIVAVAVVVVVPCPTPPAGWTDAINASPFVRSKTIGTILPAPISVHFLITAFVLWCEYHPRPRVVKKAILLPESNDALGNGTTTVIVFLALDTPAPPLPPVDNA